MGFDLDEIIFSKLVGLVKKFKEKENPEITKVTVDLEAISGRMTILARALCGQEITIFPAKREGGLKEHFFLLPKKFHRYSSLELNIKYYLFRVMYLSKQFEMNIEPSNSSVDLDEKEAQEIAKENSFNILKELFEDYPNIQAIYNQLYVEEERLWKANKSRKSKQIDLSFLFGKIMSPVSGLKEELDDSFLKKKKKEKQDEITTELDSKPVEETITLAVKETSDEDFVLTNNFEKVETIDEFNGVWRGFDGDDDLDDHQEALESVDLKYTVRVDDPVHSIYKAEFAPGTNNIEITTPQETGLHFYYDEWNYKTKSYRKDYCRVYTGNHIISADGYHSAVIKSYHRVIQELKTLFARVNNELEKVYKSAYGDYIDFDSYVDTYPDFIMKRTPDEKLYISKSKKKNDLSILILVDNSLSSDGYTGGRRVLDIQKESLICFGEVMNDYNIEFQIDTFNSKTRNYCYYKTIKKFSDNWEQKKQNIGAIEADSYTRIGPALRHAGVELENASNSKKWILLITDGKPNDYDRYEGKQGLEDVKKALDELDNKGIHTYALAIESVARYYLPLMFGHRNYNILARPEDLPNALGEFYRRILQ